MLGPCAYRYATFEELRRLRAPGAARRWLAPGERQAYDRFRDPARRESYLAGRILAKRLIADYAATYRLEVPAASHAQVEIDSGGAGGARSRPRVRIAGRAFPWSLSISHTRRGVLVALAATEEICVGVDLVEPAPCGAGFAECWFTPAERHWLRHRGGPRGGALLWAAKEAVYKAVNRGEPFSPRRIEVLPDPECGLRCTLPDGDPHGRLALRVAETRQGEVAVVAIRMRFVMPTSIFFLGRHQ